MIDWQFIQKNPLSALTDIRIIQSLCAQYGVRPSRENGQSFLIEPKVAQEMAAAAELKKDDVVLEIGPGFGALTAVLAQKAGQVIAVEKDPYLFDAAKKIFEKNKNIQLILGDILKIKNFPPEADPPLAEKFKIISNLPYNITSMVLRRFTEEEPRQNFVPQNLGGQARPELIVLLVQKEVAERVCAKPGKMSLLSLAVQFYAQPEIIKIFPPNCFWPKPEIFSAILKIRPLTTPRADQAITKKVFQLAHFGFASRRKQLQNNLAAGLRIENVQAREILIKAGFDPRVRAQDLSVDDWLKLANSLENMSVK